MNQFWGQFNLAGEDPNPVPPKFQVSFGPPSTTAYAASSSFPTSRSTPIQRPTNPFFSMAVQPQPQPQEQGEARQDNDSVESDPFAAFERKQTTAHKLQFDGGAAPNPGPASSGAILFAPDGKPVIERGIFHRHATNNYAEYYGLILGLKLAKEQGVRCLEVEGDSMLVVKQMNGQYKVSDPHLLLLYKKAKEASREFDYFTIRHIYREHNTEADRITKLGVRTRANHERVY